MTVTSHQSSSVDVLLVEDNPGDVRLAREAFAEVDAAVSLSVVNDGGDAVDFLWQRGEYTDTTAPGLILLDLDLPVKNGTEVLKDIKSDESLRRIPVIMLTSSEHQDDIETMYERHANAYVTKPNTVSRFMEMIESIEAFWLSVATLPTRYHDR